MDYPYTHDQRGLELTIESYSIDGTEAGKPTSDRLVELTGWTEWDTVTVSGTLRISDGVFSDAFPTGEADAQSHARLLLARDCRYTHDRGVVASFPSPSGSLTEGREYDWTYELSRTDVYAQVALTPVLVRTNSGPGVPGEHAWAPDQEVATGAPATIVTDDVEEWLDGNMPVKLKPFSKSGLPGDNLFSLDDTQGDEPVLWINSELNLVSSLLVSKVPAGPKAQLRGAIAAELAHPVWVQLVLWTATDVDDTGSWAYDWQEAVLEHVVAPMWDCDDATEAAIQLNEYVSDAYDSDGSLGELSGDLNRHLQGVLGSGEKLTNVVENHESD